MSENVDGVKRLAEGSGPAASAGSYFGGFGAALGVGGAIGSGKTTDALVKGISQGYISLFNSFVILTEQEEETMIFSKFVIPLNVLPLIYICG